MVQSEAESAPANNGKGDVLLQCEHCGTSLVVDAVAAGMTLKCQSCGAPTTVPHSYPSGSEATPERLAELRRHLKENESQRTEVKGYINQLSIQLHRWQLRLQALDERNNELTSAMAACGGDEGKSPPG